MAKIEKDSLGYLGFEFQAKLLLQIITDTKFGESIIDIINPNFFNDEHLRIITATVKDAYDKYEIIPDMGSLESRLLETVTEEMQRRYIVTQLRKVQEASLIDSLWVQDTAMKFCKQKELKKSIDAISKIIDKGNIEDFEKCEELLKKALDYGNNKDDGTDVTDDIDAVLADDFRKPIPTGIKGLDAVMNGGLSKGELAIILAPFGIGKTTMVTKIANTAKNLGYNVLQIFFEDDPKIIKRKHLACWSGYELNNLGMFKEELKALNEVKKNEKGFIKLKKFPSDGTTIPMIKQYIRKNIGKGFKPDLVLLDYIDCVSTSEKYNDVNVGEGKVMRQFESMLYELDIAGWTCVQGNRSSIKSEIVESDQMGGSIKKGQIGHFVCSIAKSLEQKENGTANMAILKSRFGKDGMVFNDILFDNARIQIEMEENNKGIGRVEHNKDIEETKQQRVSAVFQAAKRLRDEALGNVL